MPARPEDAAAASGILPRSSGSDRRTGLPPKSALSIQDRALTGRDLTGNPLSGQAG